MDSSFFYESDFTNLFSDKEINSDKEITNSNNELISLSETENNTELNTERLYTRTLLLINSEKEREMLVQCTSCSYLKTVKVKGFKSSNFVKHYKFKHPNIAYNKESEKTRKKNIINNKILSFIINNNLSLNIINSESFQDLIHFFKPDFIINREIIKSLLESNFQTALLAFNNELKDNIKNNGSFFIIFDIWTSNS
ncbi:hypothetical protein GGR58DRAFT_515379 [Xylaria digitata]|nr:hypothetical protein GGR58DRAFT_515379 [Xylaria digitata]